jgi:hypothetical protein
VSDATSWQTLTRAALLRLLDQVDTVHAPGTTLARLPGDRADLPADLVGHLPRELPTGMVAYWGERVRVLVQPPFPTDARATLDSIDTTPLRALLTRSRTLAVILVRLGGYSAGLYRDGRFELTKTGGRFVKNRHRKGGQSQRRFERIREGQIREHFDDVAEVVRTRLEPHAPAIDSVVLGGDRRTVQAYLARAPLPAALAAKVLPRVIDTPEPRLDVLQRTPAAIWSSRVLTLAGPHPPAPSLNAGRGGAVDRRC